jgi:hypothetical protein
VENITYSLVSNSNSEYIGISINEDNQIDIYPMIPEYSGSTVVTVRALDPGQNYSDESFNITYLPVNDPPTLELLTPEYNSIIPSDSVILKWVGDDIDSAKENLTFTVFFGQELQPPKIDSASDIYETQYLIEGLNDKTEYHWRVSVKDDAGKATLSQLSSFTTDQTTQPRIQLLNPADDAIFPETVVTFDWELLTAVDYELTYKLYIDTNADPLENGLLAAGITETEFTVNDLEPDTTYYWTVIPWFESGKGICIDGVQKFTIDPSKTAFGLNIQPTETELKLTKGEEYTFSVKFSNLGTFDETIIVQTLPRNLSNNVKMLHSETISIDAEGSRDIEFAIDSSNLIAGDYTITIIADSIITPAYAQKNITFTIAEPKSDDEGGAFSNFMDFLPIIIIIIIAIIGLAIIIRYKPKEDKLMEELGMQDTMPELESGADSTDILYKPPTDSITGSPWPAAVSAKEDVPSFSPYPPEDEVPQLPAAYDEAPSSEPPATTITPTPTIADTEPEGLEPDGEQIPDILLPEDIPEEVTEPVSDLDIAREIELPDMPEPEPETVSELSTDAKQQQYGESLKLETIPSEEGQLPKRKPKKPKDINDYD